jgi:hypothetical protein
MVEASLILTGVSARPRWEVAVQVTLIGEAGGGGDIGDRLAGLEQSAGLADTVRELQRVGWETGAFVEEADEAELAYTCGGGELVEADVPLRPVPEVVVRAK